jgi:hypothetical protein
MSVNIYDGTNLTPIAGKTVPFTYTPAPQSMIGDEWVSGQSYAVGDYRIDGNVLYKCKTAHTSSASNRPPYASYWTAVSVVSAFASKDATEDVLINSGWLTSSSFSWNSDGYYNYYTNPSSWPSQATFEKYSGYGKLFFRFLLADSSNDLLLNEVAPAYYTSAYWGSGKSLQGGVSQILPMHFGGAIYPYDGNLYFRISGTKSFIDAGLNNRKTAIQLVGIK